MGAAAAALKGTDLDDTIPVAAPAVAAQRDIIPPAAASIPPEAEPQSHIPAAPSVPVGAESQAAAYPPLDEPLTRVPEDRWSREGAKPKEPIVALGHFTPNPKFHSSTPNNSPWMLVNNLKQKKKSPPRFFSPPDEIPLTNRFSLLDFPHLPPSQPPPLLRQQVPTPSQFYHPPKLQRNPRQSRGSAVKSS